MKTRAFLLLLPVLAAACTTPDRASVELQAICAMTDDCKFQATCTNTLMGNPWVDASVQGSIWVAIQVANQMPNNQDVLRGKLNTNDAHIDGYVLAYGGANLGNITVPTNQLVPADGTTVIEVELVPNYLNATTALQTFAGAGGARLLPINVRARGYLDDGSRFETGDFPVGLWVCNGCGIGCPTGTSIKCGGPGQLPHSCG